MNWEILLTGVQTVCAIIGVVVIGYQFGRRVRSRRVRRPPVSNPSHDTDLATVQRSESENNVDLIVVADRQPGSRELGQFRPDSTARLTMAMAWTGFWVLFLSADLVSMIYWALTGFQNSPALAASIGITTLLMVTARLGQDWSGWIVGLAIFCAAIGTVMQIFAPLNPLTVYFLSALPVGVLALISRWIDKSLWAGYVLFWAVLVLANTSDHEWIVTCFLLAFFYRPIKRPWRHQVLVWAPGAVAMILVFAARGWPIVFGNRTLAAIGIFNYRLDGWQFGQFRRALGAAIPWGWASSSFPRGFHAGSLGWPLLIADQLGLVPMALILLLCALIGIGMVWVSARHRAVSPELGAVAWTYLVLFVGNVGVALGILPTLNLVAIPFGGGPFLIADSLLLLYFLFLLWRATQGYGSEHPRAPQEKNRNPFLRFLVSVGLADQQRYGTYEAVGQPGRKRADEDLPSPSRQPEIVPGQRFDLFEWFGLREVFFLRLEHPDRLDRLAAWFGFASASNYAQNDRASSFVLAQIHANQDEPEASQSNLD